MYFTKTITAVAAFAASGALALPGLLPPLHIIPDLDSPPVPLPGPANDILRALTNDISYLKDAASTGLGKINTVLSDPTATAEHVNAKVNAHIAYIQQAAMNAAWGVQGDVAEYAKDISAAEAKSLKGDAELLLDLSSDLCDAFKRIAAVGVSAANTELASSKSAMAGALQSIANPLAHYCESVKSNGSDGAEEAVADLKATVAGLVSNMKRGWGLS